ncbi:MAG: NlpC/P60 family protein [Lachnospiraceae bacterium]|nr:NlpC/P60 family protein [Lachnospiraceae bacterium]
MHKRHLMAGLLMGSGLFLSLGTLNAEAAEIVPSYENESAAPAMAFAFDEPDALREVSPSAEENDTVPAPSENAAVVPENESADSGDDCVLENDSSSEGDATEDEQPSDESSSAEESTGAESSSAEDASENESSSADSSSADENKDAKGDSEEDGSGENISDDAGASTAPSEDGEDSGSSAVDSLVPKPPISDPFVPTSPDGESAAGTQPAGDSSAVTIPSGDSPAAGSPSGGSSSTSGGSQAGVSSDIGVTGGSSSSGGAAIDSSSAMPAPVAPSALTSTAPAVPTPVASFSAGASGLSSGSGTRALEVGQPFYFYRVEATWQRANRRLYFYEELPSSDEALTLTEDGQIAGIRAVGCLAENGRLAILKDIDDNWVYAESGRVRGFVLKADLKADAPGSEKEIVGTSDGLSDDTVGGASVDRATDVSLASGEPGSDEPNACLEAEILVPPSENKAFLFTKTTAGDVNDFVQLVRETICERARLYLGNPYVWGGTSLTEGCDCSGFVQSLFGLYDLALPRTSGEQSGVGLPAEAGNVDGIEAGDLIFYGENGRVYHVLLALGDGRAINAAGKASGIVISDIDETKVCAVRRVLAAGEAEALGTCIDGCTYDKEETELIWAITAQEDDTSYEGALAVISSAVNRARENYGGYGTGVLAQLTADGQFCYSPKISDPSFWQCRLGGQVPDYVKMAVQDCLNGGAVSHGYLNFRSSNRTGNYVPIGGNWYF